MSSVENVSRKSFEELFNSFIQMIGEYFSSFLKWLSVEENQKLLANILEVTLHFILINKALERRGKRPLDLIEDLEVLVNSLELQLFLGSPSFIHLIGDQEILVLQETLPAFVELAKGNFVDLYEYFYKLVSRSNIIEKFLLTSKNRSTLIASIKMQ